MCDDAIHVWFKSFVCYSNFSCALQSLQSIVISILSQCVFQFFDVTVNFFMCWSVILMWRGECILIRFASIFLAFFKSTLPNSHFFESQMIHVHLIYFFFIAIGSFDILRIFDRSSSIELRLRPPRFPLPTRTLLLLRLEAKNFIHDDKDTDVLHFIIRTPVFTTRRTPPPRLPMPP